MSVYFKSVKVITVLHNKGFTGTCWTPPGSATA